MCVDGFRSSLNEYMQLSYDLSAVVLDIHSRTMKTYEQTETHI